MTDAQIMIGRQVASRLVAELRDALRRLPLEKLSLVELADYLKLDRTLCQRVLVCVKSREPSDLSVLVSLPGPRGLLQLLAAMRGAGAGDAEFDGLAAATKLFAEYLQGIGSQAALGRRLSETGQGQQEVVVQAADREVIGVNEPARPERMFNDAAAVTGCAMDLSLTVAILNRIPGNPLRSDDIFCTGHVGYVGTPRSLPISFHTFLLKNDAAAPNSAMSDVEGNTPFGLTDNCVLHDFSTRPLPTIVGVPTQAGNGVMHIVDSTEWRDGRKRDLFTLNRIDRELTDSQPYNERELSSQISYPSRAMLLDVYVERCAFKTVTTPQAGCHVWDNDIEAKYRERWLSMLPVRVPLEVLPPRIEDAGCDLYPRQAELTQKIFSLANVDRSRFIGFRMQVSYPVWRAWYRVRFDFVGE